MGNYRPKITGAAIVLHINLFFMYAIMSLTVKLSALNVVPIIVRYLWVIINTLLFFSQESLFYYLNIAVGFLN